MNTKLTKLATDLRGGIALELSVRGEQAKTLSNTVRDANDVGLDPRQAERSVRDKLRESFTSDADEVHVHKNRNGTFSYAVGKEPTQWPEDIDRES